jgi:hypothetical protein
MHLVHFLSWEIYRDVPTEKVTKWNILDAMWGVSVVWESIKCAVIYTCFTNCDFGNASSVNANSDEEICELVELHGHTDDCSQHFQIIYECWQSCPTTTNQPKSLDGYGPSPEHTVVVENEGKMEETPPQDAIMALSVLDTVESVTQMTSWKLWMKCKTLCQKCIKKGLKQSSSNSYF